MAIKQALAFGVALFLGACGGADTGAKTPESGNPQTFTYAPPLDKIYHETMRRIEETSIPGSPMRESEQWTMDWDVVTTRESNLFKRTRRLVGLKIAVNGAEQLKGDEVKPAMATIDVLTDKDANVVDVRQWIDLIVPAQIQKRFGAHLQVGIVNQPRDVIADGAVAGSVED